VGSTQVYLVTGGFYDIVVPVAEALGISEANIFANRILFDDAGAYAGFDESALTSRTGGKAEVVHAVKARPGHGVVAMIGDGATDMEARPPADVFVGFGGNAIRAAVRDGADWFVTDFDELTAALS
jgi:phosphoserine phosphatase